MHNFKRIAPAFVSLIIFCLIVYYIPPPKSWYSATILQILIFFIPLLLFFTFLLNIFFDFFEKSFSLSLGILILIVLKSIDELNLVTALLTLLGAFLLSSTFKKPLWKKRKIRLPNRDNESKLTR